MLPFWTVTPEVNAASTLLILLTAALAMRAVRLQGRATAREVGA